MNILNKIASSTLILIGLGWLGSLFWSPQSWADRAANQINLDRQDGMTSQNFNAPQGQSTFNRNNPAIGEDSTAPSATQRSQSVGQSVTAPVTPATSASPDSSPATPVPTPAASPGSSPATPVPTPAASASPSPTIVPEPIRAGW